MRHALRLLAVLLAASAATAQSVPVPDFTPPQSGEHPRLFFRKGDVGALRTKAQTPEGKEILARLRKLVEGPYTLWHAAGCGFLYQFTGEKAWADRGREMAEKAFAGTPDRDARYSWTQPGGELRAGPSLSAIAMAYDLCHDGWDAAYREKVCRAIMTYDANRCSLEGMSLKPRHMPASNHWGSIVGGVGLAVLAIRGDAGADDARLARYFEAIVRNAEKNLTEGFGESGYFAEAQGPGTISSDPTFVPFLQALKVCAGKDYLSPGPNAQWITLRHAMEMIPVKGQPYYPCRDPGGYGTEVFNREGMSHGGQFSQGFGAVEEKFKPGLLWVYRNFVEPGEKRGFLDKKGAVIAALAPGEKSYDGVVYPHRAGLALVNWPIGMKAENPAGAFPRAVGDRLRGYCMFRNRWKDENDVLVTVSMGFGPKPYSPPKDRSVIVWGLGKRARFGEIAAPRQEHFEAGPAGGVVAGGGTCLGVDFSGSSGADALLVMVGSGARPGSGPFPSTTLSAGGTTFEFLFVTSGRAPEARVQGDQVVVGGQTVSYDGGKIRFQK